MTFRNDAKLDFLFALYNLRYFYLLIGVVLQGTSVVIICLGDEDTPVDEDVGIDEVGKIVGLSEEN